MCVCFIDSTHVGLLLRILATGASSEPGAVPAEKGWH